MIFPEDRREAWFIFLYFWRLNRRDTHNFYKLFGIKWLKYIRKTDKDRRDAETIKKCEEALKRLQEAKELRKKQTRINIIALKNKILDKLKEIFKKIFNKKDDKKNDDKKDDKKNDSNKENKN